MWDISEQFLPHYSVFICALYTTPQDWWNSTSFTNYYRTWNVVVHDWLFYYGYRDFLWVSVGATQPQNQTYHQDKSVSSQRIPSVFFKCVLSGSPVSPVAQIPPLTPELWFNPPSVPPLIPAAVQQEIPNSCHAVRLYRLCCGPRVRPDHWFWLLLSCHVLSLCHHWRWES